jgi:thiamine-monophosphate kinase
MKLKRLSEGELISAIKRNFTKKLPGLVLGIGDDAAVIKGGKRRLILTKDVLIEDIHFLTSFHPAYLLGRKSLNINLSDVAAMGGKPEYALLGLGVPSGIESRWLEDFFSGFHSASEENGVGLVGGDVSQAAKITISVTVIGEGDGIIRRSGAKPGHHLFVTGTLGDAKQGFLLLKRGHTIGRDRRSDPLLKAFLDPVPQVGLGRALSRWRIASSMIDLSDGLSVDLSHLCQESRCGAEIYKANLPLSPELRAWQRKCFDFALHGGEDYQLLFTVPPSKVSAVTELQKKYRISFIGKMKKGREIHLIDNRRKRKRLEIKGYQHF